MLNVHILFKECDRNAEVFLNDVSRIVGEKCEFDNFGCKRVVFKYCNSSGIEKLILEMGDKIIRISMPDDGSIIYEY